MDFVKGAFEQLGGRVEFWKVAMKPGRPFAFGRYSGRLLFGLPGNPVSALVTFLLLVRPALLQCRAPPASPYPPVREYWPNRWPTPHHADSSCG